MLQLRGPQVRACRSHLLCGAVQVGLGGCDGSDRTYIYSFAQPLDVVLASDNLTEVAERLLDPANILIPASVHGCAHGTVGGWA